MYDYIYDPEGLGLRSVNKCHTLAVSTNKSMATAHGRLTLSPIPNQQIELRVSLSMWIRLVFKLKSSGIVHMYVRPELMSLLLKGLTDALNLYSRNLKRCKKC